MQPLVSIITPTFRRDLAIVLRCIRFVQQQTYPHFEHLIFSDGLYEKHLHELILNVPKTSYGVTQRWHGGYGGAVRQEVMTTQAKGQYYVFLDDDNILFPRYLERMVEALQNANDEERFAICEILHFGPVQRFLGPTPFILKGEPKLYFIDTLQVMVEAETMKEVGWVGNDYCADGRTYEELGRRFKYVKVNECLGIHM